MKLVFKIAAGIVLAFAMLAVGQCTATAIVAHQLTKEAEQLKAATNERAARQKAASEAEKRRLAEAKLRRVQEADAKRRERSARDKAFSEWYTEPAGCSVYQNDRHMVECVDHRIKASRTFDALWAKGEISHPRS